MEPQTLVGATAGGEEPLPLGQCRMCGRPAAQMCSACGSRFQYCGRECQMADWPEHSRICAIRNLDGGVLLEQGQEAAADVAGDRRVSDVEDLRFYLQQLYELIVPVISCMLLSTLWVKISLMGSDFRPQRSPLAFAYVESDTDDSGTRFLGSLQNALIIIANVVVATVLLTCLIKNNCYRALFGFIFLSVTGVLFLMGYLLLLNLIQVFAVPLDQLTLYFALYNFVVVGAVVVFWRGPLRMTQTYAVIISSLMAFSLTGLESWTTWLLLGFLVVWGIKMHTELGRAKILRFTFDIDLIAVLCPFGPLRMIVEHAKDNKVEIPGLLYSVTMVYFGAHGEPPENEKDIDGARRSPDAIPLNILQDTNDGNIIGSSQVHLQGVDETGASRLRPSAGDHVITSAVSPRSPGVSPRAGDVEQYGGANGREDDEEEDGERSGLKLGLGDFVFYSVLIARTAMFDWITTIACMVAILTGLNMTIFLLAVFRRALPALPISITFALLFYFASAYTLVPFASSFGYAGVMV